LSTAVSILFHDTNCLIHVNLHHDSGVRAKMEKPELVAGGE
jgi:hypothetical protein